MSGSAFVTPHRCLHCGRLARFGSSVKREASSTSKRTTSRSTEKTNAGTFSDPFIRTTEKQSKSGREKLEKARAAAKSNFEATVNAKFYSRYNQATLHRCWWSTRVKIFKAGIAWRVDVQAVCVFRHHTTWLSSGHTRSQCLLLRIQGTGGRPRPRRLDMEISGHVKVAPLPLWPHRFVRCTIGIPHEWSMKYLLQVPVHLFWANQGPTNHLHIDRWSSDQSDEVTKARKEISEPNLSQLLVKWNLNEFKNNSVSFIFQLGEPLHKNWQDPSGNGFRGCRYQSEQQLCPLLFLGQLSSGTWAQTTTLENVWKNRPATSWLVSFSFVLQPLLQAESDCLSAAVVSWYWFDVVQVTPPPRPAEIFNSNIVQYGHCLTQTLSELRLPSPTENFNLDIVWFRYCLSPPPPIENFNSVIVWLRYCPTQTLSDMDIVQVTPPPHPQKISTWTLSHSLFTLSNLNITSEMKCCTADVRGARLILYLKVLLWLFLWAWRLSLRKMWEQRINRNNLWLVHVLLYVRVNWLWGHLSGIQRHPPEKCFNGWSFRLKLLLFEAHCSWVCFLFNIKRTINSREPEFAPELASSRTCRSPFTRYCPSRHCHEHGVKLMTSSFLFSWEYLCWSCTSGTKRSKFIFTNREARWYWFRWIFLWTKAT